MTEYERLEVEVKLMGWLAGHFLQMNNEAKGESRGVTLGDLAGWFEEQAESEIKRFIDNERDKLLAELSGSLNKK